MTPTAPTTSPAIYCRHCGYDLRATPPDSPRCPECGRIFAPANPRTFRRRPLGSWLRHIKRAAYALLTLTLILAAIWLWLFWGWYDEQRALSRIHATWSRTEPLSPWLREYAGPPGFVLDRVAFVQVTADLGPVDLAPLLRLKELERLELTGRAMTDLRPLVGCIKLRKLYFRESFVTDLTPLAKLQALEKLYLPPTVTNLAPLAGLMHLKTLDLEDTGVTDLSPLAGLPQLDWIDLAGTRVTDLRPLAGHRSLRVIYDRKATITEAQAEGHIGLGGEGD